MTYESLGGPQKIVHAYAEADFLDHLICVFGVDVVFYGLEAVLGEVGRCDLDQIGDFGLGQTES